LNPQENNQQYVQAAIDLLCHAQDTAKDGGVAGWFSFIKGWSPSYPETTGYIISTFFDFSQKSQEGEKYRLRAFKMADWLLTCQMESGAFPGHHIMVKPEPRVFNTGQIVLGLVRAFKESENEKYLKAAIDAGEFLLRSLDHDGAWRKYAYNGVPHTYYTRVSWSLLELWKVTGNERYKEGAAKNLNWTLKQRRDNGWFQYASFDEKHNPYTHTIAYLVSGILESGIILGENKWMNAAQDVLERLLRIFEIRKFMPGDFNDRWRGNFKYSCLTGDAQISILWQQLYQASGDARFLNAALKINDYLKSKQWLNTPARPLKGGIPGSDPLWGAYHPFWIPSWAVKFFADALLLEDALMKGLYAKISDEYCHTSRP
jgi:hypothetical protein